MARRLSRISFIYWELLVISWASRVRAQLIRLYLDIFAAIAGGTTYLHQDFVIFRLDAALTLIWALLDVAERRAERDCSPIAHPSQITSALTYLPLVIASPTPPTGLGTAGPRSASSCLGFAEEAQTISTMKPSASRPAVIYTPWLCPRPFVRFRVVLTAPIIRILNHLFLLILLSRPPDYGTGSHR
ncbi:unnamed protein product [Protopolystoma xenopodis]|uniref:Uncharacterized protein n=1 Tax=Protopolystoma xenopodis TaxID=117903 RepID=A0A448XBX3_9PLAT|nr:unnamed protein product [Protopolystoma xenopodis]